MTRNGAASRAALACRARFARRLGIGGSRTERFRRRLDGQAPYEPSLAELRQWPRWPGEEAQVQSEVWMLASLVASRDSLLDEIEGNRLRQYAAAVGEARLEQVLALPRGGDGPLALPDDLCLQGQDLACAALPAELARRMGLSVVTNGDAGAWVADAEGIVIGWP